jgi:STE24 endopeptidase
MNEPKAVRYQRLMRRARVTEVAIGLLWLGILSATPLTLRLAHLAADGGAAAPAAIAPFIASALFSLFVALGWECLSFPVTLAMRVRADRRFGRAEGAPGVALANDTRLLWIRPAGALAASALLAAAVGVLGVWWWAGAGLLAAASFAIALQVVSRLLVRLGTTRPIGRRTLMSGVREIARRAGVPVSDIQEWQIEDGARATALIAGLGRSRRVLVASEVVRDWSDDEVAVVVAHELAHHVHRDVWRTLALDAALLAGAFAVAQAVVLGGAAPDLANARGLSRVPLLVLTAAGVWLACTPLRLAQSRAQERRADRFALNLTGEAAALAAAVRRLGERHLVEERPSRLTRWFFHRHPPVAERIALAEGFARAGRPDGHDRRAAPRRAVSR